MRQFCGNVFLNNVSILLISRYPHEFDLHPEIVGDADIMLTNDFLDSLSLKDRYRHFCGLTSSCRRFVPSKRERVHNMKTIIRLCAPITQLVNESKNQTDNFFEKPERDKASLILVHYIDKF